MKTFTITQRACRAVLQLVVLMFLLSTTKASLAQTIRYVKKGATGTNDGTSWNNAYTELADALKWAEQNKGNWESQPLRIYVSKGSYNPLYKIAEANADGVTTTSKDNAFVLVKNVQLYGGFDPENGISALDNSRIFGDNGTILSGDLDGNDASNIAVINLLAHESRQNNAYRVVLSAGDVGSACLDGFTILGGNGTKDGNYLPVNGQNVYPAMGSGIANIASSPKLTNLTIRENAGRQSGGGIYNWGSYPQISNSTITRNWTNQFGGGISETYSQSAISNVVITYNGAGSSGGGLHTGTWASVVSNVTINHNYAGTRGGGIYNEGSSEFKNIVVTDNTMGSTGVGGGLHNSAGEPRLMNVTIARNSAVYYTAGVYTAGGKPKFFNSIIWGNTLTSGTVNNIYKISGAAEFQYNLIQGSASWKTNWGSDLGNNIDGDPLFVNAAEGNYALSETSPAVNAGSNTLYQSAGGNLLADRDLDGKRRVRGNAIDLGAYESLSLTAGDGNVIYVNKNVSSGDGTGNSWINAVTELADALKWAKQNQIQWSSANKLQIWVAAGTYTPMYSPADANFGVEAGRDNAFLVGDFIQLYGGFDGSESTILQRNWVENPVILSGASVSSGNYLYHVLISAGRPYSNDGQNASVDGFTIRDGNANGVGVITVNGYSLDRNVGGGLLLHGSLMSVNNCIVTRNRASTIGGGFYLGSAGPTIKNVVIHDNYAEKMGSAIFAAQVSLGTIINTTSSNNTTGNGSYDVNFSNGFITIKNSVFCGTQGRAIRLSDSLSLYNSYFQGIAPNRGSNNLNGAIDPQFTDPANGDFSLKNASPLINRGNNGFYPALDANSLDIASNTRVFNYENGGIIDVGAYEFQSVQEFHVRYVRAGFSGDGHTWATATGDLQAMINESKDGNQIWVAAGTYIPNRKADDVNTITPNDRNNAFVLKEGVKIYGGFLGNENLLEQRNFSQNESILSGALDGESVFHVVLAIGTASELLTSNTKLDGFTITSGNANTNSTISVKGQDIYNINGAGLYNFYASPEYANIKLTGNHSGNIGGGAFNWNSNATFTNLTATGNTAGSGAAVANYASTTTFTNARISGNAASYGGGFYNISSSANIVGSLISGNTANFGGGVYNSSSSPIIINSTISANTGYGIYNTDNNSAPYFKNSIVFGNTNGVYSGTVSYINSLVQGIIGVDNGNMGGDIDPIFSNLPLPGLTTAGDFSLTGCSPVINAGDNSVISSEINKDISGNVRIYDNHIDLGAYEYQSVIQTGAERLAVNANAASFEAERGKTYRIVVQGDACRSVAVIRSGGLSPLSGQTTVTTWVDASVQLYNGAPYVQRHYDISPASNPETATATLTLYFSQAEFTAFNASGSSDKLPTAADDATGKSHMRIYQYHGIANGGTGPASYTGTPVSIDPSDEKIVWNQALERWEVTFDVTGFSGFFAGSQSSPLPVKLVSFAGKYTDKRSVDLKWKVAEQSGILEYVVEYSTDGRSFSEVGRVQASENLTDDYQFEAVHAFNANKAYYRLHILEAGADSYSRIISVDIAESAKPVIYPMPASDFVRIRGANLSGSAVKLINIQGRLIQTILMKSDEHQVDISALQPGLYFLQMPFGATQKIVKQ